MMSLKSKRELLEVVRPRYLKAKKLEKQKMLDEFTGTTGYHRKHAIRALKNQVQIQNHHKGKTKTYKTIYRGEVVQALEQIWEICGQICSKRLQPYLPEAIKVLERCRIASRKILLSVNHEFAPERGLQSALPLQNCRLKSAFRSICDLLTLGNNIMVFAKSLDKTQHVTLPKKIGRAKKTGLCKSPGSNVFRDANRFHVLVKFICQPYIFSNILETIHRSILDDNSKNYQQRPPGCRGYMYLVHSSL